MSGYEIAINGLLSHSKAAAQYADKILKGTTVTASADPSAAPVDLLTLDGETTSVEDNLIGLITVEHGYKANAKLISVQREMDDALLNILS